MTDALHLLLGEDVAGTLTRQTGGRLSFTYAEAYATSSTATPVSVSMPLQVRTHGDAQVTPWLWGLLPDSDAVISRWSREFQVSAGSPYGLLATPLGEDCPGAVRLVPVGRVPDTRPESEDVEWLTEADVAQRLRDLRRDTTAWLGTVHRGRFSLAGAQAKTALLHDGRRWGDPHGRTATSHILKPAIEGLDSHDLNEHLCLSAMRAAGLRAVRSRIETFEDQSAIVLARYDRTRTPTGQRRLHQEDLCQALGVHPGSKYQNEGGPGPRDVATLFRRVMPQPVAAAATRSFLDALVWNWLIAGTDAHAKNYSLLLLGGQVRLAPFYDVASALPYDLAEQRMRLAMKLGSGYAVNPGSRPWKRLSTDLGLNEDEVRERAARLADVTVDAFVSASTEESVRSLGSPLPDRLVGLVADRVRRCRRLLEEPGPSDAAGS